MPLLLVLVTGCVGSAPKYSAPKFGTEVDACFECVAEGLDIIKPYHILEYKEWIVLIAFAGNDQDTFYLYEKATGRLLSSAVKYANGPREVTMGIMNVTLNDGELSYNDMRTGKRLRFSIDEYVARGVDAVITESFEVQPYSCCVKFAGNKHISYVNKSYYPQDSFSTPRIQVADENGRSSAAYDSETLEDSQIRFWTYSQPKITVSPDNTKMAVASGLGAILETFSLSSGIKNTGIRYFFPPGIVVADDSYDFTSEALLGFNDLCSTDDRIVASLDFSHKSLESGGAVGDGKPVFSDIAVFDWNGMPDRLYHTGSRIEKLCVSREGGTAFAVIMDKEGGYSIGRLNLTSD